MRTGSGCCSWRQRLPPGKNRRYGDNVTTWGTEASRTGAALPPPQLLLPWNSQIWPQRDSRPAGPRSVATTRPLPLSTGRTHGRSSDLRTSRAQTRASRPDAGWVSWPPASPECLPGPHQPLRPASQATSLTHISRPLQTTEFEAPGREESSSEAPRRM